MKPNKKGLFFSLLLLISFGSNSQTTVSVNTLLNLQQEIEFTYTVSTEISSLQNINIEQFGIYETDTVLLYVGNYSSINHNLNDFVTFSKDDSVGELKMGVGAFFADSYYSKLIITKQSGLEEEFIFN